MKREKIKTIWVSIQKIRKKKDQKWDLKFVGRTDRITSTVENTQRDPFEMEMN